MQRRNLALQRTLDSLMAEEASESSDSSYESSVEEFDAADSPRNDSFYDSPVASPPSPLLAAEHLKADSESARRSESFEPPRDPCEIEAGSNILPTPEHTVKRRNVCFGANATFEAGVTPPKVRSTTRAHMRAPEPTSSRVRGVGATRYSSRVKSL